MSTQTRTNPYSLPTTLQHAAGSSNDAHPQRKSWKSRLHFLPSSLTNSGGTERAGNALEQTNTNSSAKSRHVSKWWKIRLFRGMIHDVRRRAPFYWSDWRDAWDYRVVPATVYMYFAKYVPSW
jgi:hypothetical protein